VEEAFAAKLALIVAQGAKTDDVMAALDSQSLTGSCAALLPLKLVCCRPTTMLKARKIRAPHHQSTNL
jgi:hypothetical protein